MSLAQANEPARPRLGFVGLGWIGQARVRALLESGAAEVAAVADPSLEQRDKARELAPAARRAPGHDEQIGGDGKRIGMWEKIGGGPQN
jgi:threonine dehydrogenase-like Zn-dependent dehydrogenase